MSSSPLAGKEPGRKRNANGATAATRPPHPAVHASRIRTAGKVAKARNVLFRLERVYGVPERGAPEDPLDVFIQAILSQNTNDRNRDLAYARLKKAFPTREAVRKAPEAQIYQAIYPCGLGHQKAARIKGFLNWLKENCGKLDLSWLSQMDTGEAERLFQTVKGIGPKTVKVVLLFACGRDVFPVDTHIHRVTRRLGLIPKRTGQEKAHVALGSLIREGKRYPAHLNLIRFGREVCHARRPDCGRCPLRDLCVEGPFE